MVTLRKKDVELEFWPRLTREKVKNTYIKTDFSKWVDEDEQDGEGTKLEDDMGDTGDMGGMGGMPGMGGFGGAGGGMDFEKVRTSFPRPFSSRIMAFICMADDSRHERIWPSR
jgi:hypothetical protein